MQFGNWNITQEGIVWNGQGSDSFMIPGKELIAERPSMPPGSTPTYDWLLKATEQDWLTEDDLYDLNYAFVYAAARFGVKFNYEVFDNTLEEQYEYFQDDEDDDEDDGGLLM